MCATLARGGCVRRAACRDVLARSWLEVAFGRPWSDWDDSKTWLAAVTAPETRMRVPEHAEVAERIAVLRTAKMSRTVPREETAGYTARVRP